MATQILLITGMTPDCGVFRHLLPSLPTAQVVPWIEPRSGELIQHYASRLAQTLGSVKDSIICGVSFGGIVAGELSLHLKPKRCVLVSSVRSPGELPRTVRIIRPFVSSGFESVLGKIGGLASKFPARHRTEASSRLTKLAGPQGAWHRWATASVLRWQPSTGLHTVPMFQIHGSCDRTFPLRYVRPDLIIPGGGHEVAVTHADSIAAVLTRLAA